MVKWGGLWPTYTKIKDQYAKTLGQGCQVKSLSNGFHLVICSIASDKEQSFNNGLFFIDCRCLFAVDWYPNFNPQKVKVDEIPIWFKLSDLLHGSSTLELLGDRLGSYVKHKEVVDQQDLTIYTKMLVKCQRSRISLKSDQAKAPKQKNQRWIQVVITMLLSQWKM